MIAGLGLKLVMRDAARTAVAVGGIAVAVLIAFVEMGFMNGVVDSHLRIVEAARGDLVVLDARRSHLNKWDELLAIRVPQIRAVEGVSAVSPVYQAGKTFKAAPDAPEQRIVAVAFPPDNPPLELGWSAETLALLRTPGTVLMDRLSRSIYGELQPGQDVWLDGRLMRLGGFVSLGPTIVIDGTIAMSESTFRSLEPDRGPEMAVVRLAPGADATAVKARIAQLSGDSVEVFTKHELAARESLYLMRVAPLGLLFGAGMAAGLFVGLVICYQVLYVAVRRRISAYATLKAMGFANRFLLRTVLEQAWAVALIGYAVGLALAAVAYHALAAQTGLVIELNAARCASIAAACLVACTVAGALAALKAIRTPPAELF
jgi:putative ABC transport system permease protein